MITDKLTDKVKLALLAMQRYPWEQGTAMQAFLEQGNDDVVIAMAKEAVYRSIPDGRVASIGGNDAVTDPCAAGEALVYACKITDDPTLKDGLQKLLNWALNLAPRSAAGIVYHLESKPQFWSDSMYMLPPFLAAAGHYQEALKQIYGYWEALCDSTACLMRHMWDDGKQEYARPAFWGGGIGWTLAGIARVIDLLPQEFEADKARLQQMAEHMINSLLPHMRDDGLFYDVVDDPATFVETNLSQMLAYTLFRGMASGWLHLEMRPVAQRLRAAATGKIDRYGLVQDVCGAPNFDKPGVSSEGQAFYLLMEAAAQKFESQHP